MVVKHPMIYAVKIGCLPNARVRNAKTSTFNKRTKGTLLRVASNQIISIRILFCKLILCPVQMFSFSVTCCTKDTDVPCSVLHLLWQCSVLAKWQGTRGYLPSFLVCRTPPTAPCHVRSLAVSSASLVLKNLFLFVLQNKTVTESV